MNIWQNDEILIITGTKSNKPWWHRKFIVKLHVYMNSTHIVFSFLPLHM